MRTSFLLIFIAALLSSSITDAQIFGRRAPKGAAPPKFLLVTLLTRQNQRDYLKKHRPDLLREFDRDVTEVAKRTVKDFSQYFKYCPVYFFIDSMSDKVATGELEGVLLDSLLQPVSSSALKAVGKNYFIAHYGSPIPQPDSVRPSGPENSGVAVENYGDDPTALFREKLIVTDADFKILSPKIGPRTNYVRALRPTSMSLREYRIYRRALTYNAERWFIDYMPCAYSYDATLRTFFR